MSFSLPKNVPSFDSAQRSYEDGSWGSTARMNGQNGHTANGKGNALGGMFEKKGLPMYKDKPYGYPASGRVAPWYKRRRVWLGAVIFILGLFVYIRRVSSASKTLKDTGTLEKGTWSWLKPPSASQGASVDWEERRQKVKEAFVISWDGYAEHAWGKDEYHPIKKFGYQMTPKGMGWIIVDALDTLMIMNLTSRLSHAREWMSTSLDYDQDHEVNTFETTIRMLGGLLSAHYLSTTYPDLAPLSEDDHGTSGEDLYIEKATDLADRLSGAFDSASGIPYASVNLQTNKGIPSHDDGGASSTAEAASLQLEFKYLAMLTGEKAFWDRAEKVIKIIDDNGMEDGLLPIFIYADRGTFRGENIRLGSRGDSYYEYLIKQYFQTQKQEPIYLELWDQALAGVRKHLITYSSEAHLTILAERPEGLHGTLSPKMDHLVCFMPGTIALGATEGQSVAEAKKSSSWGKKQEEEMELARELTKTCWGMYKVTATGLAPEIAHFKIDNPPHLERHGILSSEPLTDEEDAAWRSDYVIKPQDSHNLQRPETVESLFYMWRITGDEMYREWGWEMFTSFVKYTALEDGSGFTSLSTTTEIPPATRDNMESFWLAETLKYFYLLFSPNDFLPLDQIVINTEAHIFPRFELKRGLNTGWKRKPRDKDGNLLQLSDAEKKAIKEKDRVAADAIRGMQAVRPTPKQEAKTVHVEETKPKEKAKSADSKPKDPEANGAAAARVQEKEKPIVASETAKTADAAAEDRQTLIEMKRRIENEIAEKEKEERVQERERKGMLSVLDKDKDKTKADIDSAKQKALAEAARSEKLETEGIDVYKDKAKAKGKSFEAK